MIREEAKSCICTIKMLQKLAYNIHGVMDVVDADNCKKIIKALGQESILDKIRTEIEQLPTKTRTNWDGCCPDIDYPEIEYVDVTKDKLLGIIDKYNAESEVKDADSD